MKAIGLSEAKDELTSVTKDAVNDDDLERILLSRSKRLKRILTDSRAAAARGETVSLDEAFAHLES